MEEHAHEREGGRHAPDQRLDAAHGDAEQGGPVGALGAGPHRDAEVGAPQEQGEGHQQQGRHHEGHDLAPAEALRADGEAGRDRVGDALLGEDVLAPPPRQQGGAHRQQLRDAEGGHGEQQAGRAGEAADDRQLDHHAEHDRRGEAGGDADQVGHAGDGDQADHQGGGHRSQVALGEVQDPVGPVDEGEAQRHQRREQARDHAERPRPGPHRVRHELQQHDQQGGGERGQRTQWEDLAAFADAGHVLAGPS
ncbi:hypothetical protein KSP35_23470 [Aquihabitans sp. G128]|nr:hypothetical protein [Aquihabitans sp. G128]QXC61234.1 hypothetical protein KSP35_23470 [Aquihabitans sp. G128]